MSNFSFSAFFVCRVQEFTVFIGKMYACEAKAAGKNSRATEFQSSGGGSQLNHKKSRQRLMITLTQFMREVNHMGSWRTPFDH